MQSDGRILGERNFSHGLQNAALILPLLNELCKEHGVKPGDIDQVAVSVGPGSFTGLRIGVTLAKSLCFATGAKLIAVPTMPVIALNAPLRAGNIMPILDAKRDQVFAAVYRQAASGILDEIIAPRLINLPDMLAMAERPLLVLGEGVSYHAQHLFTEDAAEIENRTPKFADVSIAPAGLWIPRATTVAAVALRLMQQGAYADPFTLTPLYIRKPEAQERMEAGLLKHLEI